MNNQKTKLQQVVEVLHEKGYDDAKIEDTLEGLADAATTQFLATAALQLSEEDKKAIEHIENEEKAEEEIMKRYEQATGESADANIQAFLERFSEEFLKGLTTTSNSEGNNAL